MNLSRTSAPDPDQVAAAAAALRRGEICCVPTETTYGLAVDPRLPEALARLSALKQRAEGAAFGLIAADAGQARALARVWPERAEAMAAAHWPGALTLVVPARADLHPAIIGPGGGVGVRVSPHPFAAALPRALGHPVTATSANPAGRTPALSAAEARAYFGDQIAVYLDAGPAGAVSASTVVAVAEDGSATLLRAGAVALPEM